MSADSEAEPIDNFPGCLFPDPSSPIHPRCSVWGVQGKPQALTVKKSCLSEKPQVKAKTTGAKLDRISNKRTVERFSSGG